jgi:phospho-N-acetylmuramoyl-pentapeptide-transferase
MLYYLFNYLNQRDFPGAGMFNYVTFRAAIAVILALVVSVWFGNWFIKMLKRKKVVETQRDASIDPYNTKKIGVPTMGGVIIITAILIPVLLVGKLHSVYTLLMIATTLILGILGFSDDYIKTFRHKKDGLPPKVKLAGQILLGLIVGLTLRFSPAVQINETVQVKIENNKEIVAKSPDVKSTRTTIPFVKSHNLNYADLFKWAGPKWMYNLAWVFLVLLTVFIVAAVSNGSNLNDGMDGMASGNSAIIGITLLILAYISSNAVIASHLNLMYIPGSEELVVFLAAFVGALVGFLWFNSYPAQIFMGDTGSLTIGGIIAVSAIIMHKELLLPLLCGVFLFEIFANFDVSFFVKHGKKHRIWKKAPLHDHFRTSYSDFKKTWPNSTVTFKGHGEGYNTVHHEVKITIRFWIVTILLAAFTLLTFKIR